MPRPLSPLPSLGSNWLPARSRCVRGGREQELELAASPSHGEEPAAVVRQIVVVAIGVRLGTVHERRAHVARLVDGAVNLLCRARCRLGGGDSKRAVDGVVPSSCQGAQRLLLVGRGAGSVGSARPVQGQSACRALRETPRFPDNPTSHPARPAETLSTMLGTTGPIQEPRDEMTSNSSR